MVKLSQQQEVVKERPTRTQRLYEKQQAIKEIQRLKSQQQQAKQIQQDNFSDIKTSQEYELEYNKLSPTMKEYFLTPKEVKQQEDTQRQKVNVYIQEQLVKARQEQIESDNRLNQKIDYYKTQRDKGKLTREQYNRRVQEVKDKYSERKKYWQGYEAGLNKLQSSKEVLTIDAVYKFANKSGKNERQEEVTTNKQLRESQRSLQVLKESDPYANYYQELEDKNKNKINWKSPTVRKVLREQVVKTLKTSNAMQSIEKSTTVDEYTTKYEQLPEELKQYYKNPKVVKAEAQLQALEEWKEKEKSYPIYYKNEFVSVPSSQTRGTIGSPKNVFLPKIQQQESEQGIISKAWDKVKDVYSNIKVTLPLSIAGFGASGNLNIDVDKELLKLKDYGAEKFNKKITKAQEESYKNDVEKVQVMTQDRVQQTFERDYAEKIIKEEITEEEAKEKFFANESFKKIQEDAVIEVQNIRNERKITKGDLKFYGLQSLKTGYDLYPVTVKGTVASSVAVAGGVKVLSSIPTIAVNTYLGYEVLTGIEKYYSKSDPLERIGGGVQAVVSGSFLAYSGYKGLTKATIKTKELTPKSKSYTTPTIATQPKNVKTSTGVIKRQQEVFKVSQQVSSGKRTIVNTRIRDLFRLDPIYQGIPYQQKAKTLFKIGNLKITTGKSAYQKAMKVLVKSGYTKYSASNILRYRQPIINLNVLKGTSMITPTTKGYSNINIEGTITRKRPIEIIDKSLGIKTRGGKDLVTDFLVKGRQAPLTPQYNIGVTKSTGLLTFKNGIYYANIDYNPKINLSKNLGKNKVSLSSGKQKVSFDADTIFQLNNGKTPDFLLTAKNVKGSNNIQSFGTNLKSNTQNFNEIKSILKRTTSGKFTSGKVIPKSISQTSTSSKALKVDMLPPIQTNVKQIKSMIAPTQTKSASKLIAGIIPIMKMKQQAMFKSYDLKNDYLKGFYNINFANKLKFDEKTMQDVASTQTVSPATKVTTTPTITTVPNVNIDIGTPTITTPTIPEIKTQTSVIPFEFEWLIGKKKKTKKKKKRVQTYARLPDFTSRSLGLTPQKVKKQNLKRELKKIFTGLEIRKGIKVS